MLDSPFDLENDDAYRRWRDEKLAQAPTELSALIVEVQDPRRLTDTEHAAILERCRRANMAIYIGQTGDDPNKTIPTGIGARFGLRRLDHNRGADEDAVTSLTVQTDAGHRDYIPYSNRPIDWHTDGYYNSPEREIFALLLHCVQPAATGGENALLDHEIAYILMRDKSADSIRALMHPECMTIPASFVDGEQVRPDQSGPVFSVRPDGRLHMRFTNRSRNIRWREDALTAEAVACLKDILKEGSPWHFKGRLEAGWGLVSNNVLHTRTGFTDGPAPRLLYRARYYDRIEGT
ncbi:TauD/TfdA family dioxygenase [Thiorhodococcus mannitoliphagus]|uniref:TauD/TfdA family dioxygenase n=1 Tax=Thiorhodococcus mannitoliphagus TaxID=329406 RepID=A0A6P1DMN1_9GAMM|nr:TauD/TfdA family dioxygenase [Thiorhodococcus mannitoliphagus]NEX19179.1 TauD/TfdA family dioxygenase [Thiorhodococcus mannitoliphagus]